MNLSKQLFAIGTSLVLGGNLLVASPSQTMNRTELPRRITIAVDESDSFGTICKVIAKLMGIDASEIKKSSILIADLGMDSLDLVEVVMECEKQLSVSFPDEMWNNFGKNATVNDLVNAFDSLLKKDDKTSNNTISFSQANIKVNGTPYTMLAALLEAQGFPIDSSFCLTTTLPDTMMQTVVPQLAKAMKVKGDINIDFSEEHNTSEVLTVLMKAKYAKKSNKKADFYKIQYSLKTSDFDEYIKKYPKSKFVAEAENRRKCAELWADWKTTMLKSFIYETQESLEDFARKYYYDATPEICFAEGYEPISRKYYEEAEAIGEWLTLLKSEQATRGLTHGSKDCDIYLDYLGRYGIYSYFGDVASDSLEACFDNRAWLEAEEQATIEAFEDYVAYFPKGRHTRHAQNKIDDWQAWATAREKNSYSGYCEYFNEYPEGDSVALAISYMKQKEQEWWDNAQKKNTLAAYDDFIDRFPKGYYSNEAKNKAGEMRLEGVKNEKETINSLEELGIYSQFGYSLVGLVNIDKETSMTISLIGKTGEKVVLEHGESQWVRVKNGKYKILVQAAGHENWWGNVEFENKIYADGWYSTPNYYTYYLNLDADSRLKMNQLDKEYEDGEIDVQTWVQRRKEIIDEASYDKKAYELFAFEALLKVLEEKGKMEE